MGQMPEVQTTDTAIETQDIEKRTWTEFKESGLLWWINRILHLFGWAIVIEMNEERYQAGGPMMEVYPAHVKYRGFSEGSEERGFEKLTTHLAGDITRIAKGAGVPIVETCIEGTDKE